jgi:Protein of unknown function (DUF998)
VVETLSVIAAVVMVIGTCTLVLLHVLPTGYNPIRDAVSHCAIPRYRAGFWVFTTAGGVSGLALTIALAQSHAPKPTLTIALLLLSAAARLLIPFSPTDQSGSRFQTTKGTIHMALTAAIFGSIAVAASNLGGTLGNEPALDAAKGTRRWLAPAGHHRNRNRNRVSNQSPPARSHLRLDRPALLPVINDLVLGGLDRARSDRGLTP